MKDSKIAKERSLSGRRPLAGVALAVAGLWTAGLLIGGCTSDPTNLVGAGLIDNRIDSTLVSVEVTTIEAFSGIRVDNATIPLTEQETLYLGTETDTRAAFLVNFDFGAIDSEQFPPELFVPDSIATVKLSLVKLLPYKATTTTTDINDDGDTITTIVPTGQPLELIYQVNELLEPFDPLQYEDYPASLPAFDPLSAIAETTPVAGTEPSFNLILDDFLRWVQAGTKVGFLVRLSGQSDPGLVGFASGELTTFSEIPDLAVGSVVGPQIKVNFEDRELNLQIPPADDTSVFSEVDPVATTLVAADDGFTLRTGLRSYPALRFDLGALPPNALINRAVLSVTNDTSTSYGPEFSVLVSEIVADVMDEADLQMPVTTVLDSAKVYPLTYRSNLRAEVDFEIEFDITTGIRRAVNRVNETERGLLLSGVEDKSIFPFGNLPPDLTEPDFYYRQLNFLGLADADPAHRPRLKIWYSVVDELSGGGK